MVLEENHQFLKEIINLNVGRWKLEKQSMLGTVLCISKVMFKNSFLLVYVEI